MSESRGRRGSSPGGLARGHAGVTECKGSHRGGAGTREYAMERRDFVTAAGLAPFARNVRGANDRIVVGQIGLGGRGKYELSVCRRNAGVRIAAVCDVYRPLVDGTIAMLGGKVDGYQDFRRILDRRDIDAVFVSTPDHWHAIPTIMACQAGKDVYCEKPLTHTILEGRRMVEAARKYRRMVQTGSQQRSAEHYAKCVELIRGGYIGKVSFVECWNYINSYPRGMGNPPDSDPPAGVDWNFYLGPAPLRRYNRNRFLYNFRWFWDTGCGMMTDWGAHHFDIIHWAMNVDAPLAATCAGGKYLLEDNSETPDTFTMDLDYPGFAARYTVRYANARVAERRPYGIAFYGTKGTLVVDRSSWEVIPENAPARPPDIDRVAESVGIQLDGMPGAAPAGARRRAPAPRPEPAKLCEARGEAGLLIDPACQEAHVQNWLDSIRSRKLPVADVEIGHRVITACHLGVIAYRTGRRVRWDAAREAIVGDPEAHKLTTKVYRAPWRLPEV